MTDKEASEAAEDKTGQAEESEEPTLDELLNEFEEPASTPEPKEKPNLKRVVDFVDRMELKEAREETQTGIKDAVTFIREDEKAKAFSDRLVEGFLHALANENPSFLKAFENRATNPAAWNKAKGLAKSEFLKEAELPDDKIVDDIEAAKASVRGSSTEVPESPAITPDKLNKMSDMEFANYKQSLERR